MKKVLAVLCGILLLFTGCTASNEVQHDSLPKADTSAKYLQRGLEKKLLSGDQFFGEYPTIICENTKSVYMFSLSPAVITKIEKDGSNAQVMPLDDLNGSFVESCSYNDETNSLLFAGNDGLLYAFTLDGVLLWTKAFSYPSFMPHEDGWILLSDGDIYKMDYYGEVIPLFSIEQDQSTFQLLTFADETGVVINQYPDAYSPDEELTGVALAYDWSGTLIASNKIQVWEQICSLYYSEIGQPPYFVHWQKEDDALEYQKITIWSVSSLGEYEKVSDVQFPANYHFQHLKIEYAYKDNDASYIFANADEIRYLLMLDSKYMLKDIFEWDMGENTFMIWANVMNEEICLLTSSWNSAEPKFIGLNYETLPLLSGSLS